MKKNKHFKTKKTAVRVVIFVAAWICISTLLLIPLAKLWSEIYSKYKEKEALNIHLTELKAEEQNLTLDVEKMQDPEYIARYLREKYLYSKDNEYIIRIPD